MRLWVVALLVLGLHAQASAQAVRLSCGDDDESDLARPAAAAAQHDLARLVQAALDRSHAVGAARALAEAATRDIDETRAARDLQSSLALRVGPEASRNDGRTRTQPLHGSASLNLSQLLWDGGYNRLLVDWRGHLADASREALLTQQEQLALTAVSLALERSRYRAQERVYGQYARKMRCLVDALSEVVAADRGRASELLQARKALQQADLARAGTESQRRQAEIRLQRLVGDAQPDAETLGGAVGAALQAVPALDGVLAASQRAHEVAQLQRQAQAAGSYAQALAASGRPQVGWAVGAGRSLGWGGTVGGQNGLSLSVGLTLNVPLSSPGVAAAADAARWRALSAREQLDDALEVRRARVREVHEQASASLDRAERVRGVLRDSQQLRVSTQLQWQQLGRRSLFDVMAAESEHYNLRIAQVNALIDSQQSNAMLQSLGVGLMATAREGSDGCVACPPR